MTSKPVSAPCGINRSPFTMRPAYAFAAIALGVGLHRGFDLDAVARPQREPHPREAELPPDVVGHLDPGAAEHVPEEQPHARRPLERRTLPELGEGRRPGPALPFALAEEFPGHATPPLVFVPS